MDKKKRRLHELKTWPAPFESVWDSLKSFEIRRADRNFRVGDYVALREWEPSGSGFTGRVLEEHIRHVQPPGTWGLPADVCVLGFSIGTAWQNYDFDKIMGDIYEVVPPPKESPAMDKPAEGLAYLKEMSGGSGHRLELFVAGQWMRTFPLEKRDFASELTDKINSAIHSIVKPLREKAETLHAEIDQQKKFARYTDDEWKQRVESLEKDRDAWKEQAFNNAREVLRLEACCDRNSEDADRLAEVVKKNHEWHKAQDDEGYEDSEIEELNEEALAAHEALKGKT